MDAVRATLARMQHALEALAGSCRQLAAHVQGLAAAQRATEIEGVQREHEFNAGVMRAIAVVDERLREQNVQLRRIEAFLMRICAIDTDKDAARTQSDDLAFLLDNLFDDSDTCPER